jgi:nucleotide-binding universal stress UspA family protein
MRKILVPTDFSENAMNALEFAIELFKYDISEFFIMHAYQDEIYADDSLLTSKTLDEVTKIVSKNTNKQLEDILKHIQEISPNPKHTYTTISANAYLMDEADKIVDQENIDIVVMGTKGKTNDRKLTFGSQTLQVLKYVQCPVLAIPENYKYTQPKHILFPTNFYVPYKRRELKLLNYLATPYRADINMLYISKSENLTLRQKDNKDFLADVLRDNTINFATVDNKSITNAIHTYIKEHAIDMVVMVNTRHSFLENILFQSTIDEISLYIDIPFLALQNIRRY